MELPLPYVRKEMSSGQYRYYLVEPRLGSRGQMVMVDHHLGRTADPIEVLAGMRVRLDERIRWAGDSPTWEERIAIESAQSRLDDLARAIEKMTPQGE